MKNLACILAMVVWIAACSSTKQIHPKIVRISPKNLVVNGFIPDSKEPLLQTQSNLVHLKDGTALIPNATATIAASTLVSGKPAVLIGHSLHLVENGKLSTLLEIPLESIVLAGGTSMTYIAGITPAGTPLLFAYIESQGHQPLLELEKPITALSVTKSGRVIFASGASLYTFEPGKTLQVIAMLPYLETIRSITFTPDLRWAFLSDGSATYALSFENGRFIVLFGDVGGQLSFYKKSLYLLRNEDHSLFRIENLKETLEQKDPPLIPLSNSPL